MPSFAWSLHMAAHVTYTVQYVNDSATNNKDVRCARMTAGINVFDNNTTSWSRSAQIHTVGCQRRREGHVLHFKTGFMYCAVNEMAGIPSHSSPTIQTSYSPHPSIVSAMLDKDLECVDRSMICNGESINSKHHVSKSAVWVTWVASCCWQLKARHVIKYYKPHQAQLHHCIITSSSILQCSMSSKAEVVNASVWHISHPLPMLLRKLLRW